MTVNVRRTPSYSLGNNVVKLTTKNGAGSVKFFVSQAPSPITYVGTYFFGLATGSTGDTYIAGYYPDPSGLYRGEVWRVNSSNVVSGTVLSYYDASGDFIYAGTDVYPYFTLETSDGDVAMFGQMQLAGSGTAGSLWKVDTTTGHISGTVLTNPGPALSYFEGFAERKNGDLVCAAQDGLNNLRLWTVDTLGAVSSTYESNVVLFDTYSGVDNTNFLVSDPKTDNVWILGASYNPSTTYLTGSVWKFVNGALSGTLLGAPTTTIAYPVDAVFGTSDEVWICGAGDNAGTASAVAWQFLTGSGYITSTLLPHPGASTSAARHIVSSSFDGTIRTLGVYNDGTFNRPILWSTSDAFTTVSSTLLQHPVPVGGGSSTNASLTLDSSGDIWASSQYGDGVDYYKIAWKIDKTTGAVTSYQLSPPAGVSDNAGAASGFTVLPDDTKRFAHEYTSDGIKKINLAKTDASVASITNVTVGHVSGTWSNNLAYASSYSNTALGDYADLSWPTTYNATSVNVRVYNTDSLGWDPVAEGLSPSTASFQVYQGYGQSKRYLLDINPLANYLSTSALIDYTSPVHWGSAVFSTATGSGGSTWVLGQYTRVTAPGPGVNRTVMWNVSSGNAVSGTILRHPDYLDTTHTVYSYNGNQLVTDPSGDVAYTLSVVSPGTYPSVLFAVTGSTGNFSGTLLNGPTGGGVSYAQVLDIGTTGSVWVGGYDANLNGVVWRLDPSTLEVSSTIVGKSMFRTRTDSTGSAWFTSGDGSDVMQLIKINGSTHEVTSTLLSPLSGHTVSNYGYDIVFSGSNNDAWVAGNSVGGTPSYSATAWRLDGSTGELSSTYLPIDLGAGEISAYADRKLALKSNGEIIVPGLAGDVPVLWRLYGSPLQVSSTILNPWDYPNGYGSGTPSLSNPVVDSSDNVWIAGTYFPLNPATNGSQVKALWKLDSSTLTVSASFLYEDKGNYYSYYLGTAVNPDLKMDAGGNMFFSLAGGFPQYPPSTGGSLVKANSSGGFITNVTLEVTGGYGL